nr:MAG TPA: hypothetical protein [Caudoviricetes sp.]DAY35224.1 MAG TPA: hypothetical protein [Caudoviricetes sp.]
MTGKAFSHWYQRYQTILRFFVYIRFFFILASCCLSV